MDISKVVIPVAGMGTRLLPATKSQPKEMLPIGLKPIVQYVVEEMVDQGLAKILFVTGRDKRSIEDHFDRDPEMVSRLSESDQEDLLDEIDYDREGVRFFYTRQIIPLGRHTPAGLGDAVALAEDFVDGEPFVVALGDTIVKSGTHAGLVRRLIKSHTKHAASCTIAVIEVDPSEVSHYGIVKPKGRSKVDFEIEGITEKPSEDETPSRLAVASRYVLDPVIFQAIRNTSPGLGGQLELTNAISTLIRMGHKVRCVRLKPDEVRYDIGNPLVYFKAFVDYAISDQRHGYLIRQYLQKRLREF